MEIDGVPVEEKVVPCTMGCRKDGAVARYYLNQGCVALRQPDQFQDLCIHHALRSTPIDEIELVLIYDPAAYEWMKTLF